jgi:predicted transcriptional regulator
MVAVLPLCRVRQLAASGNAQAGKDGIVTDASAHGPLEDGLFAADEPALAEPVLMALKPEFYELMWLGLKTHEFRRRFLRNRPARWFVYLTAPASRLTAVIDLGPAIVDAPERVAAIAEAARPGNGASVLAYVRDVDHAFAIPIRGVTEYPGIPAVELRALLGEFQPPQGYVRLARQRELLAVCEKMAADSPVRTLKMPPRV